MIRSFGHGKAARAERREAHKTKSVVRPRASLGSRKDEMRRGFIAFEAVTSL